jgi:Carboxypeptidase regulatory-like domain
MKRHYLVLILLAGLGSSISSAQYGIIDCVMQGKLVVSRVQGQVVDPNGAPVSDARISLSRDGQETIQSKTDAYGRFKLNVQSGSYTFMAELRGFEVTSAELEVGRDIANLFHPTALRVILALPGMNCPWVTTSNKELMRMVRSHSAQK